MKQRTIRRAVSILVLLAMGNSCAAWPLLTGAAGLATGKKKSSLFFLPQSSASLSRIEIAAASSSLAKTTTVALKSTAIYSDNTNADITSSTTWASEDSSIASVSADGTATGTGTGSAIITAIFQGKQATIQLTVTSATLSSLSIACDHSASPLPKGVSRSCYLTGHFADGSSQDLTTDPDAVWATEAGSIASFDSASPDGVVTAHLAGSTRITASYHALNAAPLDLTVSNAALVSLEIAPASASLPLGKVQQYSATGTYTDSSTQDITAQTSWSSSDAAVASFSAVAGNEGLLSTEAEGSITITAASGAISNTTTVQVTQAALESITITPALPSVASGNTIALTATGNFTDGSTSNITDQVTWSSMDASIVTVSNASGTEGAAQAHAVGATGVEAGIGGISSSITFTTTSAVLTSIQVNLADASIARGTGTTAEATGIYSDGSSQNISDQVSWTTSNAGRAQIGTLTATPSVNVLSPANGSTGAATITATMGGISGSGSITVTPARLVSLQVDPTNPSVALGLSQSFTATGTYTDATTQDLTTAVTWSSSNTGVASISNAAGSEGSATTASQGSTNITAAYNPGTGLITSPPSVLTVGAATLASITIAPSPSLSLAKGRQQDFTATGHLTDGSTTDLTGAVTWSSSDATNASISNAAGSRGRLTALLTGSADITATYASLTSNTVSVTISAAVLDSISVAPSPGNLAKGTQGQFTATGVYSDATTLDITSQATWTSSSAGVATISNATGSEGLATAVAVGSTTIQAAVGPVTGSATLSVTPAVLVSIAVSPTLPSIYATQTRTFTAVGTYSDASTQDISTQVTWSSSDVASATISNAAGSEGVATGVAAGSPTITATLSGKSGSTTLTVNAADTTAPTVLTATSLSPTTVRVTFSENVNAAQATTAANYRVSLTSNLAGSCSDNSNFSSPSDISVSSVAGSGAVYTLTLGASQSYGQSYTVTVNRSGIYDTGAPTPNLLGCANYGEFTGQEQLKVSQAACSTTTSVILRFSKPVKTGNNTSGSAECSSAAECAYRYTLTGSNNLGSITSSRILDGTICNHAPADASSVCVTHTLTQSGSQYSVVAANAVDGDGFDNTGWGSIRDSADAENLQTSPRDRATFLGCGSTPVNFTDGPISVNPFSDSSSFGYLTDYNGKIYIGPNSLGNAAERFAYDGSAPESVSFSFAKDNNGSGSSDTSRNPATSRDGGTAVPPFVSLGHHGCTSSGASAAANLSTGCGPDNEDGRGVFATGTLGGTPYIFVGGARSSAYGTSPNFNYIYYSSDTAAGLNFKYIDLASITGSKTSGTSSMLITGDRFWGGYAKVNAGAYSPDFGYVSFNSADSVGSCTAGASCDADDGTMGRRTYINYIPYFGGNSLGGTQNSSPNWGYIVGVDSMYVFNGYIYAANGGLHKVGHNGSIIRSTVASPTAQCSSPASCTQWTEVAPRSNSAWHGASSNWFSIELTRTYDLIPADRAFSMFAEFNGNLYVTRTICVTTASSATGISSSVSNVAGCTDGTDTNRRAQLWKCTPGADLKCDAADWTLVADDGNGITNFGDSGNRTITMVIKNGSYLYVAFDNTSGMQVWRTSTSNPGSSSGSWEKVGGNGFGDTANVKQFFSAVSVQSGGVYYLYVSTGNSGTPVRVYRQQNN